MPGPSASLYASNNSLIDLRKTGHLLRKRLVAPARPLFLHRAFPFLNFASPPSPPPFLRKEKNHCAVYGRVSTAIRYRGAFLWKIGKRGGGRRGTRQERARIEKRVAGKTHFLPRGRSSISWTKRRPPPPLPPGFPLNECDERAGKKKKEKERYSRKVAGGRPAGHRPVENARKTTPRGAIFPSPLPRCNRVGAGEGREGKSPSLVNFRLKFLPFPGDWRGRATPNKNKRAFPALPPSPNSILTFEI